MHAPKCIHTEQHAMQKLRHRCFSRGEAIERLRVILQQEEGEPGLFLDRQEVIFNEVIGVERRQSTARRLDPVSALRKTS
jgi:hypothetical protein